MQRFGTWLLMLLAAMPLRASVIEIGDDGVVRTAQMIQSGPGLMPTGSVQAIPPMGLKRWTVQLGAYPATELLQADWHNIVQRNADLLQEYEIVQGEATVAGRRYLRLSATGFTDLQAALDLCGQLHMRGRDCFVRSEVR